MLKGIDNAVFFNGDRVFVNADSDNVKFFIDDMGLANVDLNLLNLFDDDNPETIIHVRLMACCNRNK